MKSLTLSGSKRASGRREFLAWMLAVPAVAGCSVAAREDGAAGEGAARGGGAGGGNEESGDAEHDREDEADVAYTEDEATICRATSRDAEGPYFEPGSPRRDVRLATLQEPGVRLAIQGRLVGPDCRTPLRGYAIDIWQADAAGNYYQAGSSAYRLRGKVVTDSLGRYKLETVLPGRYADAGGVRPAHLHAKILTPQGYSLLTTQIYFAGDPYLGQADYCTRARVCDSADPRRALVLSDAVVSGRAGKRATFNAVMART